MFDVIVVGAGPTGLTVANLLASYGLSVGIFEKHAEAYRFPRAGHIDHEALRIVQELGGLEALLDDGVAWTSNRWLTASGEVMFEFDHWVNSASGFQSLGFFQPILEKYLCRALERYGRQVSLHRGHQVYSCVESDNWVQVIARRCDNGFEFRAAARYLVAADGADSAVRALLKIERADHGFNERWCCVDVAYRHSCDFGPPTIVGDPHRPRYFGPLGKNHHRFEWKLRDDELDLDVNEPWAVWKVMQEYGISREDVQIIRQVGYSFEYRIADRWRVGRVLLAGDAAHTTPPAMGQGMCAGMRDAHNLAWKLALVLTEKASDSLLDTYMSERLPHVKAWSDMSLHASRVAFTTDLKVAAERDEAIRRGQRPDFGPLPRMGTGAFDDSRGEDTGAVGELFPQRMVAVERREGRFDDLVKPGFLLVGDFPPRLRWTGAANGIGSRLGIRALSFAPGGDLQDLDGEYKKFFKDHGVSAALIRPDRFIFGVASSVMEMSELVVRLGERIPAARANVS